MLYNEFASYESYLKADTINRAFSEEVIATNLRNRVLEFEENLVANQKVSLEDKERIFMATTCLSLNFSTFMVLSNEIVELNTLNQRFAGIGKWLNKQLKKLVIAVVVVATTLGAVVGGYFLGAAICGTPCAAAGAVAGGAVGYYVGSKVIKWIEENWLV